MRFMFAENGWGMKRAFDFAEVVGLEEISEKETTVLLRTGHSLVVASPFAEMAVILQKFHSQATKRLRASKPKD